MIQRLQQTSNDPVMKLNWFFSPTCPVNRRGVPTGNTLPVTVLDMLMNKSGKIRSYNEEKLHNYS